MSKRSDSDSPSPKRQRVEDSLLLTGFKDSFEAKIMSIPHTEQTHSAPHRRLDSLARLFEGKEVCAAVCFDGETILVATNRDSTETNRDSTENESLAQRYFQHLFNCMNPHVISFIR